MDIATVAGLVGAFGAILVGQALEGGHAGSLVQATAFIIVAGGTLGAVAVASPGKQLVEGLGLIKMAVFPPKHDVAALIALILEYAALARKEGVLALEPKLEEAKDPFLRRALQLLVDGVDHAVTRDILEEDCHHAISKKLAAAKLWETAGGFAPTVGILGAVLGLIHVMENLSDPSKLGGGIATAFVATVYGVGLANLVFLPIGSKLKTRIGHQKEYQALIIEGILAMQEGLPTSVLNEKLSAFSGAPLAIKKG